MTWRVQPQSNPSLWLRVGVVAGFVGLGLLVAVIVFLLRRQAPVPALTLTPASGPPGTAIIVQGQRWPANAPLTIALTRPGQTVGEEMGATWSTAEGTFSVDMTFPTTGVWTTLSRADVVAPVLSVGIVPQQAASRLAEDWGPLLAEVGRRAGVTLASRPERATTTNPS